MLNVEMVVPQLQPQEPKLKPPDGFGRENETKSPHESRLSDAMRCLACRHLSPKLKVWSRSLGGVSQVTQSCTSFLKYTRVHTLCSGCWHLHRCLHHRPFKTCLTNGMNGFLSRIAHRIPHRISPPRENTSPGFSWLSGTCGSQDHSPKQQSSHDAKKCEGHKVLPEPTLSSLSGGPVGPVRRTRSIRRGAHFLIGVFLQGLDLGQSISLGYVDPADLRCLERFQNVSKYVSKKCFHSFSALILW